MGIVEFLEARIAEDEAVAKAVTPGPWEWLDDKLTTTAGQWMSCRYRCIWSEPSAVNRGPVGIPGHEHFRVNETVIDSFGDYGYESEIEISDPDAAHIAHYEPARALAEVAAKRAVIAAEIHNLYVIDNEWGCSHSESEIRDGECDQDGNLATSDILRTLSCVYSDHPDFNEEWRP